MKTGLYFFCPVGRRARWDKREVINNPRSPVGSDSPRIFEPTGPYPDWTCEHPRASRPVGSQTEENR
jgi:hypothetical protein